MLSNSLQPTVAYSSKIFFFRNSAVSWALICTIVPCQATSSFSDRQFLGEMSHNYDS